MINNVLICGATGSGKSNFLKYLIVGLLNDKATIFAVDLKGGIELKVFKSRFKYFARTDVDAFILINKLYDLMEKRLNILWQSDVLSYQEYNKLDRKFKFNSLVLVIEEFSILSQNKKFIDKLVLLLNQCRCVNISIIITCQRPEHKVLDVRIRTNLDTIVAFKLNNSNDYNLIDLPLDCLFNRLYIGYMLPSLDILRVPLINNKYLKNNLKI